jgi:hypothetical protein
MPLPLLPRRQDLGWPQLQRDLVSPQEDVEPLVVPATDRSIQHANVKTLGGRKLRDRDREVDDVSVAHADALGPIPAV